MACDRGSPSGPTAVYGRFARQVESAQAAEDRPYAGPAHRQGLRNPAPGGRRRVSEYAHVEKPLLTQLSGLGWTVIDQGGRVIPADPAQSLRSSFRELHLPQVFRESVRRINTLPGGREWLTERQLAGLVDEI